MKHEKAAQKRAEKTRMAVPRCSTKKKFRHLSGTKSNDITYRTTDSRTKHSRINDVSPEPSSCKRNERQYEKAQEFMTKIGDSEV